MTLHPLVTITVPSLNQGRFLEKALASIFSQELPVEVFVIDGGSTDGSVEIIRNWAHRLAGWRSHADAGQAAAINEGIARGQAPYVCWLNCDDWLLPSGLMKLLNALEGCPEAPAAYGRAWNVGERSGKRRPALVTRFNERLLAQFCIICQPATLIRRTAWETVDGLDETLHLAMDYDLWWRLFKQLGPLYFLNEYVAVNLDHRDTKTNTLRRQHYQEAMAVVRRHFGRVPLKWWLAQPYAVWFRSLVR